MAWPKENDAVENYPDPKSDPNNQKLLQCQAPGAQVHVHYPKFL